MGNLVQIVEKFYWINARSYWEAQEEGGAPAFRPTREPRQSSTLRKTMPPSAF